MLGPANPFHPVHGVVPTDGVGPNPLLQNHPLMAFHPPFLYVGYVGFTVPFALAIAALISGRVGEQWLRLTRTATLIAWSALTAGIVLGAWWSYQVLGWGGYWAWDPVENAALIPWFTATAYLHSVIVQERRGMLRVWNLSLLIATYCLTILGTFLTRSGVVNSVHAFTQSAIGPTLLAYLAFVALLGLGLLAWRGDRLHAVGRIDSPLSREAAFLGNNLVLTALAAVVVTGTVYPLVAQAVSGDQLSIGEPYFDRLGAPLGLALLFLMAVAPLLPYRAVEADALRRRLQRPGHGGRPDHAGARRGRGPRDRAGARLRPGRDGHLVDRIGRRACRRAAAPVRARAAPGVGPAHVRREPSQVRRSAGPPRRRRRRRRAHRFAQLLDPSRRGARARPDRRRRRVRRHVPRDLHARPRHRR